MTGKYIFIICDGLGDLPVKDFGNKTPLEAAKTPNMDKLAEQGRTGIVDVVQGIYPASDVCHLSLFGYEIDKYYTGRGVFEAAGIGMKLLPGDVAFRANLATVDDDLVITDRRAGRISSTKEFVEELNGMEIDGIKFLIHPGTAHRAALVMRGKGLSSKLSDNDPHKVGEKAMTVKATDGSEEAERTAAVLNKFLGIAHEKFRENPINKKRIAEGKPAANYLLCRGASHMVKVPSFESRHGLKACCIAGAGLYKGIAAVLGMDILEVKGATGLPTTDVKAKFKAAKEKLKEYDFVFVHVKAADNLGEDGNCVGKRDFIEKIDEAAEILLDVKDAVISITADHSTPCAHKDHSSDPVPLLIWGRGVENDDISEFGERACAKGSIGRIKGIELIPKLLKYH